MGKPEKSRIVAEPSAWGSVGGRFKSCRPDKPCLVISERVELMGCSARFVALGVGRRAYVRLGAFPPGAFENYLQATSLKDTEALTQAT
ncbi:hypothetical protein FB389_0325 [Rarobacter incanus]|uniref:Uncharacterized protein n=1 Tax=Rarobacter incanus TaxID=153494 RepID=A0A542SM46_9MICO|nr:hypothetical protein FB389_0325 [Rarobacter incanus]